MAAVNLREEERELDNKLIELGLLEPGMTLQEKRELASVVLESTRMAEEQWRRGPPCCPQVSLLQLAKEDVIPRKEPLEDYAIEALDHDKESSHEKSKCGGSFTSSIEERKSIAEERDAEDRRHFLEKYMGGKKTLQEKSDEGKTGKVITGGDNWEAQRPGQIWFKESTQKSLAIGDGPSVRRNGAFYNNKIGNSVNQLSGAGKMKWKEQDVENEIEEGSEVEEEEKNVPSANRRRSLNDFIVEGKKNRRHGKGSSSKKWVDVVIFPNTSCASSSDENKKDVSKSSKKILLPPNKRWRRVRRKAKSSFGSGSEVDEWISSEEEQKSCVNTLTKEQILARFDEQLDCLKEVKMNKSPSGNKFLRCKFCERKSKFKVPPGYQEPDSDDEWNLWKICFYKPPSASSDDKLKSSSKVVKLKADATPLTSRSAVTRSQSKLSRDFRSAHSASKSPESSEGDATNSLPGNQEQIQVMDAATGVDHSPHLGVAVPYYKVIAARPSSTMGTQTTWKEDEDSCASGSQGETVNSGPISKDMVKVGKPVWDLLEINSEGGEAVENSGGENERVTNIFKNITVRRAQSELPEYLPVDDDESNDAACTSNSVAYPKASAQASTSFSGESVVVPSPVIPWGPRRGKLGFTEEKKDQSVKTDSAQSRDEKVDVHISKYDERIEELPVSINTSKGDDLPEAIPCPICGTEFRQSEIEVHASECVQEEKDPLPRVLRNGGNRHQRRNAEEGEVVAGGEESDVSGDNEDGENWPGECSLMWRCRNMMKV